VAYIKPPMIMWLNLENKVMRSSLELEERRLV
jgi:hypothetical protein